VTYVWSVQVTTRLACIVLCYLGSRFCETRVFKRWLCRSVCVWRCILFSLTKNIMYQFSFMLSCFLLYLSHKNHSLLQWYILVHPEKHSTNTTEDIIQANLKKVNLWMWTSTSDVIVKECDFRFWVCMRKHKQQALNHEVHIADNSPVWILDCNLISITLLMFCAFCHEGMT
jgi:hypothetical protein